MHSLSELSYRCGPGEDDALDVQSECQPFSPSPSLLISPPAVHPSLCRQAFLGHSSTSSRLTSPSTLNFQCFRSFTHDTVVMPSTGQPERQTAAGQPGGESWLVDGEGRTSVKGAAERLLPWTVHTVKYTQY